MIVSPLCLKGQEKPLRHFRLGEVEVTARRTLKEKALSKTTFDSIALIETSNGSVADLLSKHSPVFIKSYGLGSMATVSFRGTAASHTQVEWNGLNINNPMLGQVDFSLLPVWFIDQVDMLHGGSSLQEGSGALGGMVRLSSKPEWNKRLKASFMQGIASFGNHQSFLSVSGGNTKVQSTIRGFIERADNDFEFLNTAKDKPVREKQKNQNIRKEGVTLDLYGRLNQHNFLSLNAWYHQSKRDLPVIMSYEGKGRDEKQADREFRVAAGWKFYKSGWRSEIISGYSETAIDYFLMNMTDNGPFLNMDSRSAIRSFLNKARVEYNFNSRTIFCANMSADRHRVSIMNHITHEGYKAYRTSLAFSSSLKHNFNKYWSAFVLLREEVNDKNFSMPMPSLGLEYVPFIKDMLILKLNATRNYHQPTLNDLYWLPGGNPTLKPEEGFTGDIAANVQFKWQQISVECGLTGYASLIDNWIQWSPGEYRYWTAQNIKQVFARGYEFMLRSKVPAGNIMLDVNANYAFTKTTNQKPDLTDDESKGKQLIYIPVHKVNISVSASFKGFSLNYLLTYNSERFTNSSNYRGKHVLPGYSLSHISLSKRIDCKVLSFDIKAKVDNLFNKNYQAILYRAMPGRNYGILLTINY